MKRLLPFALIASTAIAGCAAFPELDGKPVTANRAAEFNLVQAPVWGLDFGDAGLRRMLAEADSGGLDAAAARARFRAADLTLQQAGAAAGIQPAADLAAQAGGSRMFSANASLRYEPDLTGRFDASLRAARLEHQASGVDLMIARQLLAREVAQGWVALGEARLTASRAAGDVAVEDRALTLLRARRNAGEATGADLASREQALIAARTTAATSQGQIALAEARLRALGVRNIPGSVPLKTARRPAIGAQTDLGATAAAPAVCAAWLRFRASDAARAEALAASRPRLVVTSSLAATAKTLAGLVAGNATAITNSVRLEGALVDAGETRNRVDNARLNVAQTEIAWLQVRQQAEIAALEAVIARRGAEAALDAALSGYQAATTDRDRVRARHAAGVADGQELAETERSIAAAQRSVDQARAEALRAAVALHAALPPGGAAACTPPSVRTAAAVAG